MSESIVILLMFFAIYFLPTMVGWKKKNRNAILVLNIFAGWTLIGWLVVLVWATTKD